MVAEDTAAADPRTEVAAVAEEAHTALPAAVAIGVATVRVPRATGRTNLAAS